MHFSTSIILAASGRANKRHVGVLLAYMDVRAYILQAMLASRRLSPQTTPTKVGMLGAFVSAAHSNTCGGGDDVESIIGSGQVTGRHRLVSLNHHIDASCRCHRYGLLSMIVWTDCVM